MTTTTENFIWTISDTTGKVWMGADPRTMSVETIKAEAKWRAANIGRTVIVRKETDFMAAYHEGKHVAQAEFIATKDGEVYG